MKSSLRSNYFQAEEHDHIEIKIERVTDAPPVARLSVDGVGYLSLSSLSKAQVVRLHQQASAALASWPADCEGYRCTNQAVDGCFVIDPDTNDHLPACSAHDQSDEALRGAA